MATAIRFYRSVPTPLLFVQPRHDHVDLMVDALLPAVVCCLTLLTLTVMDFYLVHFLYPHWTQIRQ